MGEREHRRGKYFAGAGVLAGLTVAYIIGFDISHHTSYDLLPVTPQGHQGMDTIPVGKKIFTMEQVDSEGFYHDTISEDIFKKGFIKTQLAQDLHLSSLKVDEADRVFTMLHNGHVSANYFLAALEATEKNYKDDPPLNNDKLTDPYDAYPTTIQDFEAYVQNFIHFTNKTASEYSSGASIGHENATVEQNISTYFSQYVPQFPDVVDEGISKTDLTSSIKNFMIASNRASHPNPTIQPIP